MNRFLQRIKRAYDAVDRAYKHGFNRALYSCREMSELASASLDEKLSWRQRLRRRAHLMICRMCRRYNRQMQFIRKAIGRYSTDFPAEGDEHLSDATKQRLVDVVKKADDEKP